MDVERVDGGTEGIAAPGISGRDPELARMRSALDQAMDSRGRTLLVAGDAGIGKTTLIEAFCGSARDLDARVVWGRCWEAGGAPAFWPWVQALREALALEGVEADLDRVRPFVDVVATLMPEVAGPGSVSKPTGIEGDHERFVLFDAISRVIQAISAGRPLVVVLDDLHAADPSSLFLLRFLARDIRSSRCLVVGAYREREAEADPVTRDLLAEVSREGDLITLHGLSPDAIAVLLEQTGGVAPSDSLVASLDQITEGNPFYATEIMRLLLKEQRVAPRLDLTRKVLPVPSNVIDTVLKRVRRLDKDVQRLLDVAAVLGREFSLEPLAAAASLEPADVASRLAIAVAERVVRVTGPGTYIFDHGLIREALYGSMPDKQRAALHGTVAGVLEVGIDPRGENLAEIAHHYLRAALDDVRPPFEYAARAARRALDVFAYEQAIGLYDEALALAPLVAATAEEKSEMLRGLGECLLRVGRVTEAKERLTQAASEAKVASSPQLLSQAVITYGYAPVEGGIVDPVHISLIRDALDFLGKEPSRERALLLGRWGHELMLSGNRGDAELRDRLSAEALEMIKEHGDLHDLGRVLRNRFSVILAPDRLEECLEQANELLQIGMASRDTEMLLFGRIRRAVVFMMRGDDAALDSEFKEAQRLAAETKQPLQASPVAFFKACMAGMRSDVASATKESDLAMSLGSDVPNAMGAHLLQNITWRWQTDGGADFEPFMRAAMEQRPGIRRTWRAAVGATLARSGRTDEAVVLLRESIEDLPDAPIDSTYMSLLHCTVEIARIVRHADGIEPLYDALLPFSDQHMIQVMVAPVVYYGAVEWDLATIASLLGRMDAAEEHFDAALREHTRMGARTFLAWTQAELAELLLRRGRGGDRERASELIREATKNAEDLGLTILSSFIEKLDQPVAAATSPGTASMIREGEYVTITSGDEVVRLKASKGIGYLARLLSAPDRDVHVLELVSTGQGTVGRPDAELNVGADDVGPLLDSKAKEAYRKKVRELQEDIEEAESFNDPVRADRARAELQFIADQLAGAVGLGGRDRKAASNSERARVNVTKRIKSTIEKIASGAPRLGAHLEATIKTGTYLSYSDRSGSTRVWTIDL